MGNARALLSILLVALVIGGALGAIFVQLIQFELLSRNREMARTWVIEWIIADVLLTAFLCRREIRSLWGRKPGG
ncbi:MAG: hypothetical protein HY647_10725 [Acidobacteria bacterium]|nr:hypothetical protein [Acidobacteriota bacterium]